MALQADGKIVVVGTPRRQRRLRPRPLQPQRLARPELLRRRQADDRLRRLFDSEASGRGDPGERQDRRGRLRRRPGDFALARYNPNGSLDPSFSGDGKQTTDFGRRGERGGDPGRRQDRRGRQPTGSDFALARYNPDGSLDPSFSGDGKQTTDFGASDFAGASGVAIQADGKIVAVGYARRRRLRPRPLQRQRLARLELLRRRQADDRLRRRRQGERGGAPGERQDRRGRQRRRCTSATPTSPLARYNPNGSLDPTLLRRRHADDRLRRAAPTGRTGWRFRRTARSSRSGAASARI